MDKSDFNVSVPVFEDRSVCILDFGAVEDADAVEDSKRNARAINNAIEEVAKEGGGTVIIPQGLWVTGPIRLQSNVRLYLQKQAVLKFSKNMEEYPLILTNYEGQECIRTVSPITADHVSNIAITGYGVIDGSGDLWRPVKQFKLTERQWQALMKKSQYVIDTKEGGIWIPTETALLGNEKNIQKNEPDALKKAESYYDFYRPVMVSLRHCDKVLLEGVTFMNSPAWNIHPFFCTNLTVRNASIKNQYYAQNGDGIDVESCNGVHIHDMVFETGDDAICLKSGKNAEARTFEGPCENVYVHNCLVNEGHGGFVVGSEMSRGVHHVLVEDCTFLGTDVGCRFKSAMGRGGVVEDIEINNVNMVNIANEAITMTMSYSLNSLNRNEKTEQNSDEDIPYFKNIHFNNIKCLDAGMAMKVEPIATRPDTISGITLDQCWFKSKCDNEIQDGCVTIQDTIFDH